MYDNGYLTKKYLKHIKYAQVFDGLKFDQDLKRLKQCLAMSQPLNTRAQKYVVILTWIIKQ